VIWSRKAGAVEISGHANLGGIRPISHARAQAGFSTGVVHRLNSFYVWSWACRSSKFYDVNRRIDHFDRHSDFAVGSLDRDAVAALRNPKHAQQTL
jgi:hypothetical protein